MHRPAKQVEDGGPERPGDSSWIDVGAIDDRMRTDAQTRSVVLRVRWNVHSKPILQTEHEARTTIAHGIQRATDPDLTIDERARAQACVSAIRAARAPYFFQDRTVRRHA